MIEKISVQVHVRFEQDAFKTIDHLQIRGILVKGELDIGIVILGLFIAERSTRMKDSGVPFLCDPPVPGSRFDRWLRGDANALTAEELDGYRLFKSLGCIACHQGVNVGGNLYQRHGIFHPLGRPDPAILRVPSLRNVATTPPYFHDGSAPTLDIAVRQMGFAQLNSTLTDPQVQSVVAFLRTLTGLHDGKPVGAD